MNLYVSIKEIEDHPIKLSNYGRELLQAADNIEYIKNQLNDTLRERTGLGERLEKAKNAISAYENNMINMGRLLLYAIEEYKKCENKILGINFVENGTMASSSQQEQYASLVGFANMLESSFLFAKFNLDYRVLQELNFGDLLGYSLSKNLDVIIEMLLKKDPTTEAVKRSLAIILQDMEGREHDYTVPNEITFVIDCLKTGGELNVELAKKYGDVLAGLGTAGDILEYGDEGANYLKYLLTDYSKSLDILETLKRYGVDGNTEEAVNELIAQYKSKFVGGLGEAWDTGREIILEKGAEVAFDAATGGLYSIVDLSKDVLLEIGGINDQADAVEMLLGSTIIENNVYNAYTEALDVIKTGDFTENDAADLQMMFDMYKAVKLSKYESALQIIEKDCSAYELQSIKKDIEMIKQTEMNVESLQRLLDYSSTSSMIPDGGFGGGDGGGRGF